MTQEELSTRFDRLRDYVDAVVIVPDPGALFVDDDHGLRGTKRFPRVGRHRVLMPVLVAAVVALVAVSVTIGTHSHANRRTAEPVDGGIASTSSVSPTGTLTSPASKPAYQPPAPLPTFRTCAPSQLSLTYRGGGLGTGNNFGGIVIANTGNATCQINNVTVSVSPLDATGRVIATYPGWVNTASTARLTLSAHGELPSGLQAPPAGDQWGAILLGGGGRDDPKGPNGLCAPSHEVTPYAWRITGAFSLTIRNLDPYYVAANSGGGSSAGVYACADPDLDLLNIEIGQETA